MDKSQSGASPTLLAGSDLQAPARRPERLIDSLFPDVHATDVKQRQGVAERAPKLRPEEVKEAHASAHSVLQLCGGLAAAGLTGRCDKNAPTASAQNQNRWGVAGARALPVAEAAKRTMRNYGEGQSSSAGVHAAFRGRARIQNSHHLPIPLRAKWRMILRA